MLTRRAFLKLCISIPFLPKSLFVTEPVTEPEPPKTPGGDVWGFGGGGLAFPAWFPVHPRVEVPQKHEIYLPIIANG